MKIAILNDFKEYAGAEETIKNRLKEVPPTMSAELVLPEDKFDIDKYDAFIMENVTRFPIETLKPIVDSKPYIKIEHDYGYCLKRNLIDCRGCDMPCPAQTNPFIKDLYEKARVVFSASPAHMQIQKIHLQGWKVKHDFCLWIVYHNVKIPDVTRVPKSVCYLGTLRAYKGIYDMMQLAQRKQDHTFDFAGRIGYVKPPYPKNVKYLGPVEDKWKYYAEHEYFIHLPHMLDPCPATIIEATLMGCKLIVNGNVGTVSYPFKTREEWANACEHAGTNFWKRVNNIFKQP